MDALAAKLPVHEQEATLQRETRIRHVECWIPDAPTRRRHVQSNTELKRQSYVHVRLQLENGAFRSDDLSRGSGEHTLLYENFAVRVPEGAGLGVEPDLDLLKQYRRASRTN
jgi:hypothetical protein